MAQRIRKDDLVKIISGANKGTTGKVLSVTSDGALVEGVGLGDLLLLVPADQVDGLDPHHAGHPVRAQDHRLADGTLYAGCQNVYGRFQLLRHGHCAQRKWLGNL